MENLREPALSTNDRLITPKGQLLIIEGKVGTGKSCLADELASDGYDVQIVRTPRRFDHCRRATLTSVEQAGALLEDKEALANTILILDMDILYEYSRQHHPTIAAIGSKYSELLHAKTAMTILETRNYPEPIPGLDPLRKVEYCWFRLSPDQFSVGPSASIRTDEENTVIRRLHKGHFLYRSAEGSVTEAHLDLGRSRIVPTTT